MCHGSLVQRLAATAWTRARSFRALHPGRTHREQRSSAAPARGSEGRPVAWLAGQTGSRVLGMAVSFSSMIGALQVSGRDGGVGVAPDPFGSGTAGRAATRLHIPSTRPTRRLFPRASA
jgi:hypothetical protein